MDPEKFEQNVSNVFRNPKRYVPVLLGCLLMLVFYLYGAGYLSELGKLHANSGSSTQVSSPEAIIRNTARASLKNPSEQSHLSPFYEPKESDFLPDKTTAQDIVRSLQGLSSGDQWQRVQDLYHFRWVKLNATVSQLPSRVPNSVSRSDKVWLIYAQENSSNVPLSLLHWGDASRFRPGDKIDIQAPVTGVTGGIVILGFSAVSKTE